MDPDTRPALATTKRKFDRILERLTATATTPPLTNTLRESNTSTTSLAHPITPEPPSKKSRVSDVSTTDRPSLSGDRIRTLQSRLLATQSDNTRHGTANVRLVGKQAQAQAPTVTQSPRREPNFAPYSQEQFLRRLRTFADVKKWTNKPDVIGEVEWAKRGWVCDTWNTVACKGSCEQRVSVKLRPKRKDAEGKEIEMSEDVEAELDNGLVEKYQKLIIDGHGEECLWRKAGCKDDIYRLPIANRAKSSTELLQRYHSFRSVQADLPILENVIYPGPPVREVIDRLPASFWNPPGSDHPEGPPASAPDMTAFACALFGWSGVSEAKISLATCNHCFQRVGLWLLEDSRLKNMSEKLDVPIESLRFNLLESHRELCPWKNAETQMNPKDGYIQNMAAWQTLEFIIMTRRKRQEDDAHSRGEDSLDMPRGSFDSGQETADVDKTADALSERWKRLKARLRRTASKKSLKSVKSVKRTKSGESTLERE